jgi:hypothetical protein
MQKKNWLGVFLMLAVTAIAYLPLAHQFGFLNDDWYLMFDAHVGGSGFFHEVYNIDRPLRGYLMQAAFSLFGLNPFNYQISAFVFRLLSGLAFFWLLNQLWSKSQFNNLLAAILFLIYPGFLSQINPIDYQAQIFSLACGMFSVALTLKAIRAERTSTRVILTALSILLGWVYLGMVEYFIGFEALRLISVGILYWREHEKHFTARLFSAFKAFLPFLASVGGFLFWRLFIFEAERKATDVSLQISQLFTSPLTALWWLNYLIQDMFNVTLVAWGFPLYMIAFPMRLREMLFAIGWAIFAVVLVIIAMKKTRDDPPAETDREWGVESYWLSLSAIAAGLLPVIMVNRHVILPDYSRYTLAASVGVAILLVSVIEKISARSMQMAVMGFFVAVAVMTHYGNSVKAATETESTRNFWRQVAWRAPNIRAGTTLIASYPNSSLSEDYFIWGPANFIYYPEKQANIPLQIKLPAAVLTDDVVLQIISNGGVETPLRRGNYLERDFGNVLVMIQTVPNGCVRIINANAPELSPHDQQRLFLVAPFSRLENVITEGDFHTPPVAVFGAESEHDWCYYYQKADLARQRGEWDKIPSLLKEALAKGYYPEDSLEWMPFLQAAAKNGDVEQLRATTKLLTADKFLRIQTCKIMTGFMQKETLSAEAIAIIDNNICK